MEACNKLAHEKEERKKLRYDRRSQYSLLSAKLFGIECIACLIQFAPLFHGGTHDSQVKKANLCKKTTVHKKCTKVTNLLCKRCF